MSSELSAQRPTVLRALAPLHARPVENPADPGTPDVNYVEGWVELKHLPRWPRNCDKDPVLLDHYTIQQRLWHVERRRAGGQCWVLLQVRREWILLDAAEAAIHLGFSTRAQLRQAAVRCWDRIDEQELRACIQRPLSAYYSTVAGGRLLRRRLHAAMTSQSGSTSPGS